MDSHWESRKEWKDGKRGAWCVSDFILRLYSSCFDNFVEMMCDQYDDDALLWSIGRARRWTYRPAPRIPANVAQAFRLLNLEPLATAEEVKRAYRQCAMQNHPDRYMMEAQVVRDSYTEKFKNINRAKETIDSWLARQEVC